MTNQSEKVPVYEDLKDIYSESSIDSLQMGRYMKMKNVFSKRFDQSGKIEFFARSPGRVNIIGEHIDYSGYGVLPMAIEHDVITACSIERSESSTNCDMIVLRVENVSNDTHEGKSFTIELSGEGDDCLVGDFISIDPSNHHWTNYVLCGVKGVLLKVKRNEYSNWTREKANSSNKHTRLTINMLVNGRVPMGSGLSSSSALVCSTALCTTYAVRPLLNKLSKIDLSQITASCEQFVGVQSGGMDQAISFLAKKNVGQYITFEPTLGCEPVKFTNSAEFVVSHSMVKSQKSVTAATNYNRRVIECRLGTSLLTYFLLDKKVLEEFKTMHWVQDQLGESLEGMVKLVEKNLTKDSYSVDEVASILNISVEELKRRYYGKTRIDEQHEKALKLRQRCLHVYTESNRVLQFKHKCNDPPADEKQLLNELGELMNQSQDSCRDLYEASCKELDELTSICISCGAYGSRLTGAGWGGAVVSLIDESKVDSFIEQVWEKYFKDKTTKDNMNQVLFASKPSSGGAIILPKFLQ